MRSVLLLIVASVGAGASAQTVYDPLEYAPLQVGNRWEYVRLSGRTESTAEPRYYVVAEIPATIVIDGETYAILSQQQFSLDGSPTGPLRHCAVSPTLGAATAEQAQLPDYSCPLRPSPPAPHQSGPTFIYTNESYSVGPTSYVADSMLVFLSSGSGSGGAYSSNATRRVRGLGYLSDVSFGRYHWASCPNNPADCDYWGATRLEFARVADQTYGASVVAGDAPPVASGFSVQVVPTPSAGPWQIRVRGVEPVAEISVYDLLGREVYAATSSTSVPDLAPGLYVLEARTADGRTATTRFVRP